MSFVWLPKQKKPLWNTQFSSASSGLPCFCKAHKQLTRTLHIKPLPLHSGTSVSSVSAYSHLGLQHRGTSVLSILRNISRCRPVALFQRAVLVHDGRPSPIAEGLFAQIQVSEYHSQLDLIHSGKEKSYLLTRCTSSQLFPLSRILTRRFDSSRLQAILVETLRC